MQENIGYSGYRLFSKRLYKFAVRSKCTMSSDIHKLTSIAQRFGPGQSAEADLDQYFFALNPVFTEHVPFSRCIFTQSN